MYRIESSTVPRLENLAADTLDSLKNMILERLGAVSLRRGTLDLGQNDLYPNYPKAQKDKPRIVSFLVVHELIVKREGI